MMNKKIWVILFLTGLSISCSNKDKSTKSTVSNKIDLSTEEIKFAPSEVLNAEAYNINASCLVDGLLLYVNNTTSKDELNDLLKIDIVRPI